MNESSKVTAIIPARSGSKGIADKNILLINNKPLIAFSINAALKSENIDRVIVSTDSEKYAEIARFYGAETPFLRPKNISSDTSTDLEFFEQAINFFEENDNYVPEYFVHLRPTTPLRDPKVMDEAIDKFLNADKSYTALRSCHAMSESSYKTFEIENGKLKGLFNAGFNIENLNLARQSFPKTYDCNGYIDIVRSELIMTKKILHGNSVLAFETEYSQELDEIRDINYLKFLLNENPHRFSKLFADIESSTQKT